METLEAFIASDLSNVVVVIILMIILWIRFGR